jgi:hypothetical protein
MSKPFIYRKSTILILPMLVALLSVSFAVAEACHKSSSAYLGVDGTVIPAKFTPTKGGIYVSHGATGPCNIKNYSTVLTGGGLTFTFTTDNAYSVPLNVEYTQTFGNGTTVSGTPAESGSKLVSSVQYDGAC